MAEKIGIQDKDGKDILVGDILKATHKDYQPECHIFKDSDGTVRILDRYHTFTLDEFKRDNVLEVKSAMIALDI